MAGCEHRRSPGTRRWPGPERGARRGAHSPSRRFPGRRSAPQVKHTMNISHQVSNRWELLTSQLPVSKWVCVGIERLRRVDRGSGSRRPSATRQRPRPRPPPCDRCAPRVKRDPPREFDQGRVRCRADHVGHRRLERRPSYGHVPPPTIHGPCAGRPQHNSGRSSPPSDNEEPPAGTSTSFSLIVKTVPAPGAGLDVSPPLPSWPRVEQPASRHRSRSE